VTGLSSVVVFMCMCVCAPSEYLVSVRSAELHLLFPFTQHKQNTTLLLLLLLDLLVTSRSINQSSKQASAHTHKTKASTATR
jgi:hypothetical protein